MRFVYQARTKKGEIKTGVIEAFDKNTAFSILKSYGFYVVSLEEAVTPFYAKEIKIFERITKKDLVSFSRQLAIMFKSQVPLVEALQTIARQTEKRVFREKILKISEEVEGGTSLSAAFSLFSDIFPPFYISMIKSGEASGKLVDVFLYLADYLEREYNFRSKLKTALAYPIFVMIVFLIVAGIIVSFVIPQLANVFEETEQELPLVTRIVVGASNWLRGNWYFVALFFVLLGILIYYFLKTPSGKKFFDKNILRTPFLSSFLKKLYLSRIANSLSTLIAGGLPISRALEITAEVAGNEVYKQIMLETGKDVKRGEKLTVSMNKYPKYISPFFSQMISVGEKTGTLDTSLQNVVEFSTQDLNRTLDTFSKLVEPVLIIVLGFFVIILMASVLIPLYSISF